MTRSIAVLFAVVACTALAADEPAAPLKVTEPVGQPRTGAPASGGVPVGPLGVKSVSELRVVDAAGQPVPAQLSPMVTLETGRLDWVLVDLVTDLAANETRRFSLRKADGRAKAGPVRNPLAVSQTDDAITLSNGLVKVVLSPKRFNLFENVWVDRDGNGRFADDEKMLSADQPAQLALVRGVDGVGFSTRDGTVDRVTPEDAGPLRTTVRIDGRFGAQPAQVPAAGENAPPPKVAPGAEYLKYTVRLTMWAGRCDIKVLFALRNTNPKRVTQEKIKRAAVTLKLAEPAGAAHYLIGANRVHLSRLNKDHTTAIKKSQWHHTVRLSQVGPPEMVASRTHRQFYHLRNFEDAGYRVQHYQPGNRFPFADVGFMCQGWIDLAGDNGGCHLWLRDFTYDTPKRMTASVDGTMTVDLIPEYAGKNQPYYADGGYWLGDRSYRTYELSFRFHGRPLATEADWTDWKGRFSCYLPPTAATAAKAEGIARQARHPLQLVCTPQWYDLTGALWGPMPSPADEAAAARAMGRTTQGPVRAQPACSLATEFLHYENFHYRSEWDEPRDAIVEYLRTGDWRFFRRAHSFGRNYRDLGVPRTDGLDMSSRTPGAKGAGPIPRWGKFCGCHNYGAGVIDLWLTSGDRSYRDAGVEYGYDHARSAKAWAGFGGRNWGRKMVSVLRTCRVTRDAKLKAWLVRHCRPLVPDRALRADGRALICGKHQGSWMTGLCSHAIWHNYRVNRDAYTPLERDDFEDGIVGIARNVAKYWYFPQFKGGPYYIEFDKPKPGDVHANGGGAAYTLSCIDMMTRGYLLTGDRKLLAQAKLFWDCVNGPDKSVVSARLSDFQGMGSCSFWARQLIHEYAHPRADGQPPAPVTDLKAEGLGRGTVKLTWTAPADAGGGKVAAYQVKHAPCPIVTFEEYKFTRDHNKKWSWWAGYNVAGEPGPAAPGAGQSMLIETMPAGVHHFCLVSKDDSSNESGLSNVVRLDVK